LNRDLNASKNIEQRAFLSMSKDRSLLLTS